MSTFSTLCYTALDAPALLVTQEDTLEVVCPGWEVGQGPAL